ncbi:MAG TPA: hypothetical protein VLK65_18675 [Vicinamibacteria bacterium]|nr:hypothetical protein [Vicinamibacteria bacterium]
MTGKTPFFEAQVETARDRNGIRFEPPPFVLPVALAVAALIAHYGTLDNYFLGDDYTMIAVNYARSLREELALLASDEIRDDRDGRRSFFPSRSLPTFAGASPTGPTGYANGSRELPVPAETPFGPNDRGGRNCPVRWVAAAASRGAAFASCKDARRIPGRVFSLAR